MKLLADVSARIDEDLSESLRPKFETGTLERADIEQVFVLFGQVCNSSKEIRFEMSGMTQTFVFVLEKEEYTVAFLDAGCEVYFGRPDDATVVFFISIETALAILNGNIHSSVAQMKGDIDYTGPRHDAIVFQRIFEPFLDEFI